MTPERKPVAAKVIKAPYIAEPWGVAFGDYELKAYARKESAQACADRINSALAPLLAQAREDGFNEAKEKAIEACEWDEDRQRIDALTPEGGKRA